MRFWRRRARQLEPLRRQWAAEMPPHIRKVAGHLHLPLLEEMLAATGYPDKLLLQHFRRGFPIMGKLPATGAYPVEDPELEPELQEEQDDELVLPEDISNDPLPGEGKLTSS